MKIIYKAVNTLAVLAIIPVLLFMPMFRFIMTVDISSDNQILSLLGGLLDISSIIKQLTGIDLENIPEFYTIKEAIGLFSGENAKISASDVDLSVIPPEITKFFTAAFVLFIIALVFALLTLLIGLFTKKKGLAASFSLLGLVSLFSANKCFSYIAQQLVSGKISPSSLLSSLKSLADYKDYLSFVNIDVRIFELSSAYTLMMIIFGAVIIFNIIFMLAEKSA